MCLPEMQAIDAVVGGKPCSQLQDIALLDEVHLACPQAPGHEAEDAGARADVGHGALPRHDDLAQRRREGLRAQPVRQHLPVEFDGHAIPSVDVRCLVGDGCRQAVIAMLSSRPSPGWRERMT